MDLLDHYYEYNNNSKSPTVVMFDGKQIAEYYVYFVNGMTAVYVTDITFPEGKKSEVKYINKEKSTFKIRNKSIVLKTEFSNPTKLIYVYNCIIIIYPSANPDKIVLKDNSIIEDYTWTW